MARLYSGEWGFERVGGPPVPLKVAAGPACSCISVNGVRGVNPWCSVHGDRPPSECPRVLQPVLRDGVIVYEEVTG